MITKFNINRFAKFDELRKSIATVKCLAFDMIFCVRN